MSQSLLKCSWRSDIFLVCFFDFFPATSLAVMRWCDGSLSRMLSLFNILLINSWWRWPDSNRRLNCYPYMSTVSLIFSSYNSLAFHIMCSQSSTFSTNNWGCSFSTAMIITTCGTFIPVRSRYAFA